VKETVGVIGPRAVVLRQEQCDVSLQEQLTVHFYNICNVKCIRLFC
jgi:hypothetical protein